MTTPTTAKFAWLTFNPAKVLHSSRPTSIEDLRKADDFWRALFRTWLKATHPDYMEALPFVMMPPKALENHDDRETQKRFIKESYDPLLHSGGEFHTEIGRLREALKDNPEAVGRQLAAQATGPRLAQAGDAVLGAYATIEAAKRDLVKQVHEVSGKFMACKSWKDREKAVALMHAPMAEGGTDVDGVAAVSYHTAEGELRRIIELCRGDGATDEDWVALAGALEDFVRATVAVGSGLGEAAQLCWDAAVNHTKNQIKDNFSSYNKEVAEGILGAKVGVYIAGGIITALAPIPVVGQVLAGIGVAMAITMKVVEKITIETIAERDSRDYAVVMQHLGKKYVGDEPHKALETMATIADYGELVVDSGSYVADVLKTDVLTGVAKDTTESVLQVGGRVTMFTGPHIAQLGMALDLYNADPKELRQYVSDEELAVLRQAVEWAYEAKNQRGYNFSEVLLHGVEGGENGDAIVTIGGIPGRMSLRTGRFTPDDPSYSFDAVVTAAQREQELKESDDSYAGPWVNWPDEPEFVGFTDDYRFITRATLQYQGGMYEQRIELSADGHITFPDGPPEVQQEEPFNPRNPWNLSDDELEDKYGPDHGGIDEEAVRENYPDVWEQIKQERAHPGYEEDSLRSHFG